MLLIHGWPGSWYYWRLVMPTLARDFEVIAVDQRGIGLSDKPEEDYDTGTLANDLVGLSAPDCGPGRQCPAGMLPAES